MLVTCGYTFRLSDYTDNEISDSDIDTDSDIPNRSCKQSRSSVVITSDGENSPCALRGPPSWAWQQCNRLLKLGRPSGAVTLSRCEW